jgi:RHS repeat-associated protein
MWSGTFLPFGQEWNPQPTANHYKFTGKERDSESGLDNFGARYNSSQYGRFMTPDPSNLSVDFWIPQTWNRYSYAVNNPLRFIDQNGLWPTEIHDQIIREAFPGMTAEQLGTLRQASYNTDFVNPVNGLNPQDPAASFVHGMSNGTSLQNPKQAEQMGDAFIAQNEHDAKKLQADWIASGHTGISPAALTAFGNALHTVTDRTSPAHEGNQPWFGTDDPLGALFHVFSERNITQKQMNSATQASRAAFQNTFGLLYLQMATQKPPKTCVSTTDSASGQTRQWCD